MAIFNRREYYSDRDIENPKQVFATTWWGIHNFPNSKGMFVNSFIKIAPYFIWELKIDHTNKVGWFNERLSGNDINYLEYLTQRHEKELHSLGR